jgi:hypothetical protein
MQSINFYERKKRAPTPSWNVLIFFGIPLATVLVLALMTQYERRQREDLTEQIANAQRDTRVLKTRWLGLKVQLLAPDEADPGEADLIKSELEQLSQLIQALQLANLSGAEGFLAPLIALSELTPANIALTRITLSREAAVRLEGQTHSPTSVAVFVGRLRREPAFANRDLAPVVIRETSDREVYVLAIGPGKRPDVQQ